MKTLATAVIVWLVATVVAIADPVCADRPGTAPAACTADSNHHEWEFGTDTGIEYRYAILDGLEFDTVPDHDTNMALKYRVLNLKNYVASVKPSLDKYGVWQVDVPMQVVIDDKTSMSPAVTFHENEHPEYVIVLNRSITTEITGAYELARDSTGHVSLNFALAYIPWWWNSIQLDAGIARHRLYAGFSRRF